MVDVGNSERSLRAGGASRRTLDTYRDAATLFHDFLVTRSQASSAFEDGATREDPEWSWWVWPSEVAGHGAWARLEAGDPRAAVAALQRTEDGLPVRYPNSRFFWLARLLGATLEAGAWSDIEGVIEVVLPVVGKIRSGRSVRLLRVGVGRLAAPDVPPPLVDAGAQLGEVCERPATT